MREIPIKLGPLALLLTVISICMTTLAILTFTTARADMRLAETFADTVQRRYSLEQTGQAYLEQLYHSGDLQGAQLDDSGIYRKDFELDGTVLHIGFRQTDQGYELVSWRKERRWEQDTDIGDLWTGLDGPGG